MRFSSSALICCSLLTTLSAAPLNIESAIQQFVDHNYDLLIARNQVQKSKTSLITAKERPNPTLSASYEFMNIEKHFGDTSPGSNAQATLILSHPIETAGKRDRRIDLANHEIMLESLLYEAMLRTRIEELVEAFYAVVKDETDLFDANENAKSYADVVTVAKAKLDNGFLSRIDYQKILLQQVEYAKEVENASLSLERDKETLAAILALPSSEITDAVPADIPDTVPGLDELLAVAADRPDCKAAKENISLSDAALKLEQANAVPNVTVGAEYASFGPNYQPLAGVNVSIPLPVYDRNEGEIEKARIETLQSAAAYEKTVRMAKAEIVHSLAELRSRQNVYRIVSEGFSAAKELKEKQEKIFALKGISVLELLDSQKNYREYQKNMSHALADLQIAQTRLKLMTGSLIPESKGL